MEGVGADFADDEAILQILGTHERALTAVEAAQARLATLGGFQA